MSKTFYKLQWPVNADWRDSEIYPHFETEEQARQQLAQAPRTNYRIVRIITTEEILD